MNQINNYNMTANFLQTKTLQLILFVAFSLALFSLSSATAHAARPILQVEGSQRYVGTVGQSVRLTWNANGNNNCELSTNATDWNTIPNSGSQNVTIQPRTVIYTLRCRNASNNWITGHHGIRFGNPNGRVVINPRVSQCPWTTNTSAGRYVVNFSDNVITLGAGGNTDGFTSPNSNGRIDLPTAMLSDLNAAYDIYGHSYDQNETGLRNDANGNGTLSPGQNQLHEEFVVRLMNSAGSVVHTTPKSSDLDDSSSPQQWGNRFESSVYIPNTVRSVQARLSQEAINSSEVESLDLGCVMFQKSAPTVPAAVTLTHSPEPSPAPSSRVTLEYTLTGGASNCTLSGMPTPQTGINSSNSRFVYPESSRTYSISCSDGRGGIVSTSTRVTVATTPLPSGITLTTNPAGTVNRDSNGDANVTYSYSAPSATTCGPVTLKIPDGYDLTVNSATNLPISGSNLPIDPQFFSKNDGYQLEMNCVIAGVNTTETVDLNVQGSFAKFAPPACPYVHNPPLRYVYNINNTAPGGDVIAYVGDRVGVSTRNSYSDYTANAPIPAGDYNVKLVSYDGYTGRSSDSQNREQWQLKFMSSFLPGAYTPGVLLQISNPSSDLTDGTEEASLGYNETTDWLHHEDTGNALTVPSGVAHVMARHMLFSSGFAGGNTMPPNWHDVTPVCAVLDPVGMTPPSVVTVTDFEVTDGDGNGDGNPNTIVDGDRVTLTWDSEDGGGGEADSCQVSHNGTPVLSGLAGSGNTTYVVNGTGNQDFEIVCEKNGVDSPPVDDSILAYPAVTATLTASPNADLQPNTPVTLSWDSNGTECSAITGSGSGSGTSWKTSTSIPGNSSANVLTNSTFRIRCTGQGGDNATASADVGIVDINSFAGSISLRANPPIVRFGSPAKLQVTVDPALLLLTTCSVQGVGGPYAVTAATQTIDSAPLNSETTFNIVCVGVTAPTPDSQATVRVIPLISAT